MLERSAGVKIEYGYGYKYGERLRIREIATSAPIALGEIEGTNDKRGRNHAFAKIEVTRALERHYRRKWIFKQVVTYTPVETSGFSIKIYAAAANGQDERLWLGSRNSDNVDSHRRIVELGDTWIATNALPNPHSLRESEKNMAMIIGMLDMIEQFGEFPNTPSA